MPVRIARPSSISDPVRRKVHEMARDYLAAEEHVIVRRVLASDDDHPMAPVEANALRILVDGWAASLHWTTLSVLMHLDGDGSGDIGEAIWSSLRPVRNSQITRSRKAWRAGIRAPVGDTPTDGNQGALAPVDIDHMTGQRHEMDHLLALGGASMVRRVYGTLARELLTRRAAGVTKAYAGGTMVETELSARVAVGANGELKGNVLAIAGRMPDTVVAAAVGRELREIVEVPGIGEHRIATMTWHEGDPASQGLKRVEHMRIALAGAYRAGVGQHIERLEGAAHG